MQIFEKKKLEYNQAWFHSIESTILVCNKITFKCLIVSTMYQQKKNKKNCLVLTYMSNAPSRCLYILLK